MVWRVMFYLNSTKQCQLETRRPSQLIRVTFLQVISCRIVGDCLQHHNTVYKQRLVEGKYSLNAFEFSRAESMDALL